MPNIDRMGRRQLERCFRKAIQAAIKLKKENTQLKKDSLNSTIIIAQLQLRLAQLLKQKH